MHPTRGIHASGIVKRFGRGTVLAGMDLDVAPGTLVALTGANGAGKTTVLRILATLLRPDGGRAFVHGADVVVDPAAVRRSIGVALVNERALYWRLSGRANLRFFARIGGLSARHAEEAVATTIASLDLADVAHRRVAGWSAGQRQRLILARALMGDPAVLLLDEPMRGLDDDGIARVRDLLRLHADRGAAVLVVGPSIEDFRDLCDEVLVLDHGRSAGVEASSRPVVSR